jgi:hypothetical protein
MHLIPVADKPTNQEKLVSELLKKGISITIEEDEEVRIWLEDWSLVLSPNGKWSLQ